MRFCSRCGFPLAGVVMLLDSDGVMQPVEHSDQVSGRRSRMIKESAYLTLASWAVALLTTIMWDWGGQLESVAKVASLIFFLLGLIGLLRFLYAFLFVREGSFPASEPAFPVAPRQAALPSPQGIPLTDYPRRSNTKEMAPLPSVTENTTRLLDEQPREHDDQR